jgi:signal transduction histidine kinase
MQRESKTGNVVLAVALAAVLCAGHASAAPGGATPKEAEAMVKKGIVYLKANGKDKAFAEFTSKQGQFSDRDLYLTATRLDGTVMAHGANERMLGKVLIDLKDVDGKEFVREMVETAKAKSGYWIEYKFTNPVSRKVEPKAMYCERFDDLAVCGGVYKN